MNDTDPTQIDPTHRPISPMQPDAETATHEGAGRAEREEVSEFARRADPSQAVTSKASPQGTAQDAAERAKRGVVWVRPSELIGQVSAKAAGRGIDFHAELARRARKPMVQAVATSRRAISERARRLPPVTAFGRGGSSPAGTTRSGIGSR